MASLPHPRKHYPAIYPSPDGAGLPMHSGQFCSVSAANPEVQGRDYGHRRSRDPTDVLGSWSISCGRTAIPFHLKIRLCKACRGMTHAVGLSGYRAGKPSMQRPRGNQKEMTCHSSAGSGYYCRVALVGHNWFPTQSAMWIWGRWLGGF